MSGTYDTDRAWTWRRTIGLRNRIARQLWNWCYWTRVGGYRRDVTADRAAAYKIAYEEARKTIAGQADSLKEVRDRAGVVATTVAATAALAAGLVLRGNGSKIDIRGWGVAFIAIAGAGFALAMFATIVVWWPTTVTLNMDAEMLVERWVEGEPPMSEADMHRWLAYYSGRHARANRPRIDNRLRWFTASLVGLALEIGGLIAMLLDVSR